MKGPKAKISVKGSTNYLMKVLPLSSSSRRKPGNLNPLTVNLRTFSIRPKRITRDFSRNWRPKKSLFLTPTEKLSSWVMRKENWRKRYPKLRENVKKARESTKNSAMLLTTLPTKTRIWQLSSRTSTTQSEWVRASLTNLPSRDKISEGSTSTLPTRTKYSTMKLTSVCWAFCNMRGLTRTSRRKSKITSNATRKQGTCSTERKPCVHSWTRLASSSKRPRSRSPTSAD